MVLVRDPARLDPEGAGCVDARAGDPADNEYVRQALQGVEALHLVIPEVLTVEDPEADAEALADSVLAAPVSRRAGSSCSRAWVPRSDPGGVHQALGRLEKRLDYLPANSGVAVCHLRCGYLFCNLLMDQAAFRRGELRMALPENEAMPWVAPAYAAAVAAGRLGHGGFGTTMSGLAAGVPQVVVPLFTLDQNLNADLVEAVGAGARLNGGPAGIPGLGAVVTRLLADTGIRRRAREVASEIAALPDLTKVVHEIERIVD